MGSHKLDTLKTHHSEKGCTATLQDKFDGQMYVMTIVPLQPEQKDETLTVDKVISQGGFNG
jgi:hypothetical protein